MEEKRIELSEEELENVTGGMNPQLGLGVEFEFIKTPLNAACGKDGVELLKPESESPQNYSNIEELEEQIEMLKNAFGSGM